MKFGRDWGRLGLRSKLSDICYFYEGRVVVVDLDLDTYISTENMIPNKGGVVRSAGLPATSQTQAFRDGDVLVSNIRPYFRKIWLADRNGGCSNDVLVFRANDDVNPNFLYYLLSSDNFFDYATATAKGTKMPRGDKRAIMQYSVPDIPIDEQINIAKTLSVLDCRIAENKKINHHLEQMAQAIFKSWFVDFEPWGGVMPSDWCKVRIGDLPVTVTDYVANGSFASLKENVQYLNTPTNAILVRLVDYKRNFNGDFVHITDAAWNFLGKSKLFGGEIIISNVGANAGTIFRCPRLPYKMSLAPNSIMISSALYENYLYYTFVSDNGQFLLQSILSGSAQPKFNKTDFKNLGVICPPNETLDKFNEAISPFYEVSEARKAESQQLERLRDTLLPGLMSGEISIADLTAK